MKTFATLPVLLLCIFFRTTVSNAEEKIGSPKALVESLAKTDVLGVKRMAIGVTRHGTPIYSFQSEELWDVNSPKLRVLLIGGLDGSADSVRRVLDELRASQTLSKGESRTAGIVYSGVPCVNPDGIANGLATKNNSDGEPSRGFPPKGPSYSSPTNPEAQYLWRWIGMSAPDLVVEIQIGGSEITWTFPEGSDSWSKDLKAALGGKQQTIANDSLVAQLGKSSPNDTGPIPAIRLTVPPGSSLLWSELASVIQKTNWKQPSPARQELQARAKRTPQEVAVQLTKTYGHELGKVEYIPALALVGRLRVAELTSDASHRADVEKIVAPYFDNEKPTTPTSGSGQSGHLVFNELAKISDGPRRARYTALVRVAADQIFDKDGKTKEVMPFHNEMSDALFMGGPILAAAGKLTGEKKYFDACAQHLRFMRKLCLRSDGLYRHSPLDEAAWGRGNGFPALGLALTLTEFPADHPDRAELLQTFQNHMATMAKWQDATGCWHQVVDHEESYREFTCTCMTTFAMLRGVRNDWLDRATYEPIIEKAWPAIRLRIAANGGLVDVCTGTGKQKSLREYYDRDAILGRDARGGAMALMVTTEFASWQTPKSSP